MDDELKKIEEPFDEIPDEVKDYIYSIKFVTAFEKLCSEQQLSPENIVQLKGSLYGYIAQVETEDDLLKTIHLVSKTIESSQKIIDWIKKEVTEKIMNLVIDAYVEEDQDEGEETESSLSPTEALKNIQERLTKPTVVAPITRDYSVTRVPDVTTTAPAGAQKAPAMDIYREIPEK